MILSCPACHTRYRLADGSVPPEGRDVRCAKCGNRWHEPGEPLHEPAEDYLPDDTDGEAMVERVPAPVVVEPISYSTPEPEIPYVQPPVHIPEPAYEPEDDGVDMFAHEPPFRPRPRRGRWVIIAILVLAAIIGAVALLRLYGPPAIKTKLGMAAGASSLRLELPRDPQRRKLSSGNEMFELAGKVVNSSDDSQRVPDIVAELRDKDNKAVYRWTITPPKRTIGPKQTLDFDAAEIDVPSGAHKLALSFAPQGIG